MKAEVEKLIDKIYHKQTYGKDVTKDMEKLNKLTGVKDIKSKPHPMTKADKIIKEIDRRMSKCKVDYMYFDGRKCKEYIILNSLKKFIQNLKQHGKE